MENFYVHGSSPKEQERLTLLNDLLNQEYLVEIGPIKGERVLDIGSGLGQLTSLFKQKCGTKAYVLGIERDDHQLKKAIELHRADEAIHFRKGDAQHLDLPADQWGSFDLVHTRFVLEHVPDPLLVVRNMAKAARVGGRIIIADDDHSSMKLHPEVGGFDELWKAYEQSFVNQGNDPFVGSKLVSLLVKADLKPVKIGFCFFGGCYGTEKFKGLVLNLMEVLGGARNSILNTGMITPRAVDAALKNIEKWSAQPDAAIWYPMYYAIGVKL